MKKLITMILIVIILMSTITRSNHVWASDIPAAGQNSAGDSGMSQAEFEEFRDTGDTTITQGNNNSTTAASSTKKNTAQSESSESVVGDILAFFVRLYPTVVGAGLDVVINSESANNVSRFTIEDLVFNRIKLFDANYLNIPEKENLMVYQRLDINTIIKQNIGGWYNAIRNLALALLLVVLVIIGVLMAINSVASERAKYKKMLGNWFASLAILILLPYIMAISFNVCDMVTNVIASMGESLGEDTNIERVLIYGNDGTVTSSTDGKEKDHVSGVASMLNKSSGWQGFAYASIWAVLVYFQLKFFFMYIKRLFTIGFLIVISPLITITYSIDKARDNQAQAFQKWMSEFLVNLFIQPLHALLYVIFIYSTYAIMQRAPLLAAMFLWALSRGESIMRRIFKMDRSMSMGRLGRGSKGRR